MAALWTSLGKPLSNFEKRVVYLCSNSGLSHLARFYYELVSAVLFLFWYPAAALGRNENEKIDVKFLKKFCVEKIVRN